MDILYEISYLLGDGLSRYTKDDADYRFVCNIESRLLEKMETLAGKEMLEKLTDAQSERMDTDRIFCFLQGLRLGIELLRL